MRQRPNHQPVPARDDLRIQQRLLALVAMRLKLGAHRREPLMISSIAGAVVTPIVVSFAGRHAEVTAIAGSYLGLTVLGLGVTTAIYWSRSRAWHSDSYA